MLSVGDEIESEDMPNGFSYEIHQSLIDRQQKFARLFLKDRPFATIYPLQDRPDTVAVEIESYIPSDILLPDAVKLHKQAFRQNLMGLIDKTGELLDFNTDFALAIDKPSKHASEITHILANQFWETWGDMREREDPIWGDINSMFEANQTVPNFGNTCDGLPVTRKTL